MPSANKLDRVKRQRKLEFHLHQGANEAEALEKIGVQRSTLQGWFDKDPEFKERVHQIRVEQAHIYADEVVQIADEPIDLTDPKVAAVQVANKRVRMEARQWLAAKRAPQFYGKHDYADYRLTGGVVVLPAIHNRKLHDADEANALGMTPGLKQIASLPAIEEHHNGTSQETP